LPWCWVWCTTCVIRRQYGQCSITFPAFFIVNLEGVTWHCSLLSLLNCALHIHLRHSPHTPRCPQLAKTQLGTRDRHTMHSGSAS
jgi:hypothetical protein